MGHVELGMMVYLHIARCTGYYVIFSHSVPLNPGIPLQQCIQSEPFLSYSLSLSASHYCEGAGNYHAKLLEHGILPMLIELLTVWAEAQP